MSFFKHRFLRYLLIALAVGFLLPENARIPVEKATRASWNQKSFWAEPWGTSGVHKGIDIFAAKGVPVQSSTYGIVLYSGEIRKGGIVTLILGPRWRLHYYAHLDSTRASPGQWMRNGEVFAAVGDTGNAKGKPPHLHYSIVTLIPYPWRIDSSSQGWKKMFFLDPGAIIQ